MADHRAPPVLPIATHYSASIPVVKTACKRAGVPGTSNWPDVNCDDCLVFAPPAPWLEARRAEVKGKFRVWRDRPEDPTEP